MKAAVFEGAGKRLAIREVPDPTVGPGQLALRIKRSGICGSDLHMTDPTSVGHPRMGAIIGHEFCGEIADIGEGVGTRWKEGTRVTALPFMGCGRCASCLAGQPVWCAAVRSHAGGAVSGGFAEYLLVGAAETMRLPNELSWEEGALIEPMAVAVHGIQLANLAPGANILVFGTGPIGLAVVACARALGAGTVIATARSHQRADLARALGATEFLLSDDNLSAGFARIAGGPPEVTFECVGAPGSLNRCTKLAPPRSTIIVMGVCTQLDNLLPVVPSIKELRLQFSMAYGVRDFQVVSRLLASGRIRTEGFITGMVGFEAFPEMFESLRHRGPHCKVLLSPEQCSIQAQHDNSELNPGGSHKGTDTGSRQAYPQVP